MVTPLSGHMYWRSVYSYTATKWTVPRHSTSITSIWSILIQWIRVMVAGWYSDLVNTKESILLVCDKPYYTNKRNVHKGDEIEVARNCTLLHFIWSHVLAFCIIMPIRRQNSSVVIVYFNRHVILQNIFIIKNRTERELCQSVSCFPQRHIIVSPFACYTGGGLSGGSILLIMWGYTQLCMVMFGFIVAIWSVFCRTEVTFLYITIHCTVCVCVLCEQNYKDNNIFLLINLLHYCCIIHV